MAYLKRIFISGWCLLMLQCAHVDKASLLEGSWKPDSIYSYYNGFSFTKRDLYNIPFLHYRRNGSLEMTLGDESRFFSFKTEGDTLFHLNAANDTIDKFMIIASDNKRLILKKELNPLFSGPRQERYELRYFSRVSK
jgi:hypothetical protein